VSKAKSWFWDVMSVKGNLRSLPTIRRGTEWEKVDIPEVFDPEKSTIVIGS